MSDQTTLTNGQGTPAGSQQEAAPTAPNELTPAAGNTPDSQQAQEHMIPKSRFDEVNNELKQIKAEMDKARREQEKAQAAAMAEQGKYRELYETASGELETLRPYKDRYTAVLDQAKANNAKRIEAIPEARRTLVPAYDDPMQVQSWLDANEKHLTDKPAAPNLNGGAGNRTPGQEPSISASQIREQAARYGVNPDLLAQQYGVTLPKP